MVILNIISNTHYDVEMLLSSFPFFPCYIQYPFSPRLQTKLERFRFSHEPDNCHGPWIHILALTRFHVEHPKKMRNVQKRSVDSDALPLAYSSALTEHRKREVTAESPIVKPALGHKVFRIAE